MVLFLSKLAGDLVTAGCPAHSAERTSEIAIVLSMALIYVDTNGYFITLA